MGYGTSEKKLRARQTTVIDMYRRETGRRSIPKGLQHWTLCGDMSGPATTLQKNCELLHLLREGYISSPTQFYAAEKNVDTFARTAAAVSASLTTALPNLRYGDIVSVMAEHRRLGILRPAVVNLDTTVEPKASTVLLARVMDVLSDSPSGTFLIWNFVLEQPRWGRYHTLEDVQASLNANALLKLIGSAWTDVGSPGLYKGTGKAHNAYTMCTITWRKL